MMVYQKAVDVGVSTHSRPKAAGRNGRIRAIPETSFNTQPPEGGWRYSYRHWQWTESFNTQPPEGGWLS